MKHLVLLTPAAGKTTADFGPHRIAEAKAVWAAYASGTLREIYFSAAPAAVTLIYELPDIDAVHAELARLPMVEAGLLDRQVVPLGPFLPLAGLFDETLSEPN
jgi:muconolactone delta-isomerase